MREAAVSVGSAIVVEYAGNRIVLEGRVREIVRLLMRDAEKMHLEDATGIAFNWGGKFTNWRTQHDGSAAVESVSWKGTRDG